MTDEEIIEYRPRHCVWEVTLACNLRCGHCGSSAGRPRPDELTTSECVDVVHQLADLECRLITLSGGEPTLRPDWETMARTAVARGVTVNMVTNGTTMTDDLAQRVADCGMSNVGVSLDGTPRVHDSIRGEGSFRKVERAMKALHRANVITSVLTHLNRDTIAEIEAIHDLSVEMGAAAWRTQLGKPMGNLAREMTIDPGDLLDVIPRLARIKKRSSIWVYVGDSIGYYGPHEKAIRESRWGNMRPVWSGCQAGKMSIGIESDGGVKACLSLQAGRKGVVDPFREDSLRQRRLRDIWFDPNAFQFNRRKTVFDLAGECRSCGYRKICLGGASCVAVAFTGGVAEDPYCYHRVLMQRKKTHGLMASMRDRAATAAVGLCVGLGTGLFLGAAGCDDRALGGSSSENTACYDASFDQDADPPNMADYGTFPVLSDASIEEDAEPPYMDEYGDLPP